MRILFTGHVLPDTKRGPDQDQDPVSKKLLDF
jgi:hypothetical protein